MPQHLMTSRACAAGALLIALALLAAPAAAAPATQTPTPAAEQAVAVELVWPTPAITPDDPLDVTVGVTVAAPAEYLEVRLRLFGPSGRLVYQKTEVRSDVPPGRVPVDFDYDLAALDLPPGRYPVEVRVLATGSDPTTHADRLLVVPADVRPLPVALVVHLTGTPAIGLDGRFVADPALDTRLRDDLALLTTLAAERRVPLAIACAPVLIEQLALAADGYETADGQTVDAGSEIAGRYAKAIADLRSSVSTGSVTLIDVPYALPDLAGLETIGDPDASLAAHWGRADLVRSTVVGVDTPSPVKYLGAAPTARALTTLAERGAGTVLVTAEAISAETTAAPGRYAVPDAKVHLLVTDPEAAAAASVGASAFYEAAYERLDSATAVVMLEVGPESAHAAGDVQRVIDWIAAASWLDLVPIDVADTTTPARARLAPSPASALPASYWDAVAECGEAVDSFTDAAGDADPDVGPLQRATLVAESALWSAGGTGASGGQMLVDDVCAFVQEQLSGITLDARDVTLSSARGEVPLALTNGTGRTLRLTLTASAANLALPQTEIAVVAQPADNFITLPVDLGRAISDDLEVVVSAGNIVVATTTVNVRTSHLDRLVTVGAVVLVLLVLLFFIRRRVRAAIAGTIAVDENPSDERPSLP